MVQPSRPSPISAGVVLVVALALPVVFAGQAPARHAAVDLGVASIEATQATQTPTNSIPLVARRSLAVRATLSVSGSASPVSGVTGRLHVLVGGSEVTPTAGIPPINAPFTAPLSPQRSNENDTLNFELPAPTAITASTAVRIRVDVTPVAGETNTANNTLTTPDLTAVSRNAPFLYYTSINYTPAGLGLPAASFVQPGRGDAFVRGILPVDDSTTTLYRQGLFPSLTYTEDANHDGRLDALGSDGSDLLTLLESCRQLIVSNGGGASNRVFLVGWLAGNPIDGNGLATVGGRVAFANTDPVRGQRSYAHELTHNFGFNHNNDTIDQVGWDVTARLPNNPAGNNTTGRVKPTTLFDVQFPAKLTNEAWIETAKYTTLLNDPTLAASPDFIKFTRRVAVIQGIFDPSGKRLLRLKPVFRYPWPSQPTFQRQRKSPYVATIRDTSGAVSRTFFVPTIADDGRGEQERPGAFEVMVPVAPDREIASLQINGPGGTVAAVKRSQPPRIRIVAPQTAAVARGRVKIVWEANDPDTPPAKLLYEVAYSPDAGRDWVPLAVDVAGTQRAIVADIKPVPKSRKRGIIRVFVSDGLNTAYADVKGITVR